MLAHPRGDAVHLLTHELLTERLACKLLMQEALPACAVELVAERVLGALLGHRGGALGAARLRLRLL